MTNEQINQRIAEACGWRRVRVLDDRLVGSVPVTHPRYNSSEDLRAEWQVPNYTTDLNAMHEAESFIDGDDYFAELEDLIQGLMLSEPNWPEDGDLYYWIARATARQRAEAFLRTLGKWEE